MGYKLNKLTSVSKNTEVKKVDHGVVETPSSLWKSDIMSRYTTPAVWVESEAFCPPRPRR